MPRDSSGNFSLVPGINPVTSGTVIQAEWANPTLADIAAAITESLSRSGQGGMTVPFRNPDGAKNAPGSAWANEPTSGVYRKTTNEFWWSVGNEDIVGVTKQGLVLAAGKTAQGVIALIRIQDTDPAPTIKPGEQWFKADNGGLYMRYQNPDLTFTYIQCNAIGGDFLPRLNLNTFLGDYTSDAAAAAAGVPIGGSYRTGNTLKVRIA